VRAQRGGREPRGKREGEKEGGGVCEREMGMYVCACVCVCVRVRVRVRVHVRVFVCVCVVFGLRACTFACDRVGGLVDSGDVLGALW